MFITPVQRNAFASPSESLIFGTATAPSSGVEGQRAHAAKMLKGVEGKRFPIDSLLAKPSN